jgi:dethiobiotin synthetase
LAQRIFVTATNTDIGKTYTTDKLIRHYASLGYRVGAFKPIETGVTDTPPDGSLLLKTLQEVNPEFSDLPVNDIVPVQMTLPAAPYVADNAQPIDLKKIDAALEQVEKHCDIVIIEGAGGILVPLDKTLKIIDLIGYFKAKALLVTHCRLGCINDTLLNLMAMDHAGIDYEWVLNRQESDTSFETVSAPYFNDRFKEVFILQENLDELAKRLLK